MPDPAPPRTSTLQALAAELALLRPAAPPPPAEPAAYAAAAARAELSALCLSGGGIRSAAFSLGAIQGLARQGVLDRFDYLSTVSGGGFIGGWLAALARRDGVGAVQAMLRREAPPPQVSRLRDYTNYLTPRIGLLSLDTWAAAVLYLRNVLLNWLIFAPLFALGVLAAVFYRTLLAQLIAFSTTRWLLLVATVVLALGTLRACLDVPSHRPSSPAPVPWLLRPVSPPWRARLLRVFAAAPGAEARGETEYAAVRGILLFIVAPAMIWAALAPLALVHWYYTGIGTGLALPFTYATAMLGGYALAALWRWEWGLYGRNFGAWLLATAASAGVLWLGIRAGRMVAADERPEMLAVLGPLWLMVASGLQALLHAGLRRGTRFGELDREWLARLSAAKLAPAVLWFAFVFCCLTLQRVLWEEDSRQVWLAAGSSLVSGPVVAWLGKQGLTRVEALIQAPRPSDRVLALLLPALAIVFAAALLTSFGRVLQFVLGWLQLAIASWPCWSPREGGSAQWLGNAFRALAPHLGAGPCVEVGIGPGPKEQQTQIALAKGWYENAPIPLQLGLFVMLAVLLVLAARWIPVNRFSMHGVYRNRLTRAFLGSVRAGERRAEPFTTFDPDDNVRLAKLCPAPGARPLHVINATLNLTSGTRLAWAERKAASFTFSPLACGAADLSDAPDADADPAAGAFVPAGAYAGDERESGRADEGFGITLATAMTLSGAAMSPNWGYHSSAATAFLMTLFNVRLGAWLPNPARIDDAARLQCSSPPFSLWPFLNELSGRSDDRRADIYISDGGHFENLGLYEMLRRRCRRILVVDAGQDPGCTLTDLGNAMRKAAIDLNVEVSMAPIRLLSRAAIEALAPGDRAAVPGFAYGCVRYPEGGSAEILLIKPSWLDDIPADVRAYGALRADFPHEPTSEQWFTESQFESYRALGAFQVQQLCANVPEGTLSELFARAARCAGSSSADWPVA
jgi:hypothetical protein